MPVAIKYGIPYDTFWKINPKILKMYQDAKTEEVEMRSKVTDYTAWLNGVYVAKAIASCFSKGAKYPDKPFGTETKEVSPEDEFKLFIEVFNSRFEKCNN